MTSKPEPIAFDTPQVFWGNRPSTTYLSRRILNLTEMSSNPPRTIPAKKARTDVRGHNSRTTAPLHYPRRL
jgi:hypothetical protein